MSQGNTTIKTDLQAYTKEDVIEEYNSLSVAYVNLKISEDAYRQEIHELKRNIQTAQNAETFLSNELESIGLVHKDQLDELSTKYRLDLENMKCKYTCAQNTSSALETEMEVLKQTADLLQKELADKEMERDNSIRMRPADSKDDIERMLRLEQTQVELIDSVDTLRQQLNTAQKANIQLERQIDDLKDALECSEATLHTKRNELEEKNEMYELTEERVFQLTAELATLRDCPDTDAAKRGNSLFAEVDDQRKQMLAILSKQKLHYNQIKNSYSSCQQENRSLERQISAMHKELAVCSSMFMNADQNYKTALNDRISKLIIENKNLEERLHWTEAKVISTAEEKGISWLDSMFIFCRNEKARYKEQLHSCRLQMATTEETLRNVQDEMSRWRFEALKLRCLIHNRESLLETNGVAFDADVPNMTENINKMNPTAQRPNVFVDLTKIRHTTVSRPSVSSSLRTRTKTENNEDVFVLPMKNSDLKIPQRNHTENITSEEEVINKKANDSGKIARTINAAENITVARNSQKLEDQIKISATPFIGAIDINHAQTPSAAPFVPHYRSIALKADVMSTLSHNIAQLSMRPTPVISLCPILDLLPIEATKQKINFSDITMVTNDLTKVATNPLMGATEEASRNPPTSYVVKRVIVRSKKPKSSAED